MAYFPRGVTHSSELVKKFDELAHVKIPGVVKWRYKFENDWSGDPAIFFWVTLIDDASRGENLRASRAAFADIATQHVDLLNDWDLIPYFNFRSESEQAKLKGEDYA